MPTPNTARKVFVRNSKIDPISPEQAAVIPKQILCIIVAILVMSISAVASGSDVQLSDAEKGFLLKQLASQYQQAGQYDKAIPLCEQILATWPKERFAIWAAMSKVLSELGKGDIDAAKATTEKMISDYGEDPNFAKALSIVADGYEGRQIDYKAEELRQAVIDKSPESIWGRRAEILSFINQKGYKVAQKRLVLFVSNFSDHPQFADCLFKIGQEFCWKRQYADANSVFARLDSDKAKLWRHCALTCNLVRQGDDKGAADSLKEMNKQFLNNPGLAEAMYRVGQELEWCKGEKAAGSREYVAATEAYKRVMRQFGSTKYGKQADWDCKRLELRIEILSAIENDYEADIESSLNRLISAFEGRPELNRELSWLEAWAREHGKNNAADKIKNLKGEKNAK